MSDSPLGRTLLVANPAAHSGRGAEGAEFARRFLGSYSSVTDGYDVRLTSRAKEATSIAARAAGYDTLVVLGGDGVIHEVVCGLMSLPRERRPRLAVLPLGSGNDYARTLGMARNDVEGAFAQIVRGTARPVDVGRVNGTYFAETLSFGLDAAIAIDTTARRAADTSQEGEALFVTSGLKILSQAKQGFACTARFDDGEPLELAPHVFAFQIGPSYGGGFLICPEADPSDTLPGGRRAPRGHVLLDRPPPLRPQRHLPQLSPPASHGLGSRGGKVSSASMRASRLPAPLQTAPLLSRER